MLFLNNLELATSLKEKGIIERKGGEYQQAISVLYVVAYTLKMSYKTDYRIEGFFEYVVPPLEGFWWQEGVDGVDYSDKSTFCWISVIRLPDFITKKVPIAEFIMRYTFLMPEKLLRIN